MGTGTFSLFAVAFGETILPDLVVVFITLESFSNSVEFFLSFLWKFTSDLWRESLTGVMGPVRYLFTLRVNVRFEVF